jgi:hypothetical protein
MKKILLIDTHSFIDVITNSSTELFVCDTDKTIDEIKKMLQYMNIEWAEIRWPYERELIISKYKEHIYEHISKRGYTVSRIPLSVLTDDERKKLKNWNKDYIEIRYWYEKKINDKTIIIESESDNSIDYEDFEKIEDVFNASSYHLW